MKYFLSRPLKNIKSTSTTNAFAVIISLILCLSYVGECQSSTKDDIVESKLLFETILNNSEPYKVTIQIEKINNSQFILDFTLHLDEGYYVTSTFAYDMKGRFKINIDKNDKFELFDSISEVPAAINEDFQWSSKPVKIIRNKTNYKQKIKVLTEQEFEAPISVNFVIEPRCTMEHLNFMISYQSGELSAKQLL